MRLRLGALMLACALAVLGQSAKKVPASDAVVHDQVSLALAKDPDVRGGGIQVEVKDGAVTLRGKVMDEKAREKATKVAKKVKNVTSVDNQLKLGDQKETPASAGNAARP
jgi:osmotically-inducible protein OsmY